MSHLAMSLGPATSSPQGTPTSVTNPAAESQPTQVSAMPLPPMHYVKLYGEDYVKRNACPPPPPPLAFSEPYRMFGQTFSSEDCIISSLESQGIRRLYSTKDLDRKRELKKLNHSILVNFLDLLDLLIKAPDSPRREDKIEDLNLLFIHMHHLINEFRPHQARETLRVMLHVQRRRRVQVADKFKQHLTKAQETIQEALENLPESKVSEGEKLSMMAKGADVKLQHASAVPAAAAAIDLDEMMCQHVDGEMLRLNDSDEAAKCM